MNRILTQVISGTAMALGGLCIFSAVAQTPLPPAAAPATQRGEGLGKPARPKLKALDANKDRMLSRDEVRGRSRLEKNFDAVDTNKDGQLSRAETKAYREGHKSERKR
ncbi:MAG: hypothetical protein V4614_00365 [Pseudomonadota bacterium]